MNLYRLLCMVYSARNSKEFACLFSSLHIKGTTQNFTLLKLISTFTDYYASPYFSMSTCFNNKFFSYVFFQKAFDKSPLCR